MDMSELGDYLDTEIERIAWRSGLLVGWAIGTGLMLPLVIWLAVTR